MQTILHFLEQARLLQARHDDFFKIGLGAGETVNAWAVGDIFINRLRKRIRLLEHHADTGAQFDDIDLRIVDVFIVERDLATDLAAFDRIVHAVKRTQEGRLAATRRADQRRDHLFLDFQIDVEQRLLLAIKYANLVAAHLYGIGVGVHLFSYGFLERSFSHQVHSFRLPFTSGARSGGAE